ncbi:MAG: sigma-54 dependent transcriptional regulator [Pseudomonadota bacterium]
MKSESSRFTLLLVDDDPGILSSLKRTFFEDGYRILTADQGDKALSIAKNTEINAALIDYRMPEMDGLTLLQKLKALRPAIMVIILTGHGGIQEAVKAINIGADDFLEKPFASESLRVRVDQLYRIWKLNEENKILRSKVEFQFGFDLLVGNSAPMLKLKQSIVQAGPSDAPVLIQGETGTGKELVARAIHHHSRRSEGKFVPVDCAAISETVMESELFGHVKGAFTGAYTSTLGLIRSADAGTLFMDEVGELSLNLQAKMLRTVQEKEVRPVGSSQTHSIDVRIVTATHRDLKAEVAQGNFREDLYYRLNVVCIHVPPLRDRQEDIPLLARYFVKRFRNDFSTVKDISKQALHLMESHSWPGNIRELENVIRRAVALGGGDVVLPDDLPAEIYASSEKGDSDRINFEDGTLAAFEKAAIRKALAKSGMNRRMAAQILDIGEATLYRKIKKYRITG